MLLDHLLGHFVIVFDNNNNINNNEKSNKKLILFIKWIYLFIWTEINDNNNNELATLAQRGSVVPVAPETNWIK